MTRNDDYGDRVYTHPATGEEFRSVTTILKAASKPALERWKLTTISKWAAANIETLAAVDDQDQRADLIRSSQYASSKESADIGNRAHKVIEHRALGITDSQEVLDPSAGYVNKMWDELTTEFEIEVLHAEATLINRAVGYAGSGDLIVRIRPQGATKWKRAVIDAKSGKSIYGSVALQLVGYAKAEAILHSDGSEEPMPVIHETYALHVRPRSWALIPMRYDVTVWEAFKALVTADEWINRLERGAVGRAINQGAIARMRSAA